MDKRKTKCSTCEGTGKVPVRRLFVTDNPVEVWYARGSVCPTCKGKKAL